MDNAPRKVEGQERVPKILKLQMVLKDDGRKRRHVDDETSLMKRQLPDNFIKDPYIAKFKEAEETRRLLRRVAQASAEHRQEKKQREAEAQKQEQEKTAPMARQQEEEAAQAAATHAAAQAQQQQQEQEQWRQQQEQWQQQQAQEQWQQQQQHQEAAWQWQGWFQQQQQLQQQPQQQEPEKKRRCPPSRAQREHGRYADQLAAKEKAEARLEDWGSPSSLPHC